MGEVIYRVDLINDIVFLIDGEGHVRDAFRARGKTEHHSHFPVTHYTYRSLVTPPGYCCICGYPLAKRHEPCSSSGGYHAFVGISQRQDVPDQHKAAFRNVALTTIRYDELTFYLEPDNLFSVEEIQQPLAV